MTAGAETASHAEPSNRPMLAALARFVLHGLGAAGLAYLGYWAALVVERVLPRLVAYRVAGATELDWIVGPFSVVLRAPGTGFGSALSPFSAYGLLLILPFLLQVMLLLAALRLNRRAILPGPVVVFFNFASLWTLLLVALHAQQFAWSGRGVIGQVLLLAGNVDSQSLALRLSVVALLLAGLLPASALFARWLAAGFGQAIGTRGFGGRALTMILVLLPFPAILAAILSSTPRFFIPASPNFWTAPALVLAVVVVFLLRSHRERQTQTPLGLASCCLAGVVGFALYGTLLNTGAIRLWLDDRSLAQYDSAHYSLLYDSKQFSAEQVRTLAGDRERALQDLAAKLYRVAAGSTGARSPQELLAGVRIRVVLYPSAVATRTATREDTSWTVRGNTIRAHLELPAGELDHAADAAALLFELKGAPGDEMLGRWVARWLAGTWRGESIERVAARIVAEEGRHPLAVLFDSATDAELSPLVREPLGAYWVATVGDWLAPRRILDIYQAKNQSGRLYSITGTLSASLDQLENAWESATRDLTTRIPYIAPARRVLPERAFLRGVSFTHEGFGGRRGGYDSAEAHEALRVLRGMGVNAIAVVPYGWMSGGSPRISYTGSDETDAELSLLIHRGHTLGLKVMLKPQIWIGGGQFTGTLHFADPELRARWFAAYRRFLLHYARLAELEGFDLLCIGTELGGMTAYEREWRELIADVRNVYRGPMTYAANWGDEFEKLAFWDALDYLGVNNYYPLADTPGASAEILKAGADRVAERIGHVSRRWRKPVLFTEAGFASVRGAAVEPWREIRSAGASVSEQAAAYEAAFAALDGQPWLAGIFWWKWPSHGRAPAEESITFSLPGRPAAEVIARWYLRWEQAEAKSKD
jgi:hypothetical protein